MDPEQSQARVQVAAHVYRQVVLRAAAALDEAGLGPLRPEDKMRLHALSEPAAWDLPADLFEGEGEAWLEATMAEPRVKRLVARLADEFVAARTPPS